MNMQLTEFNLLWEKIIEYSPKILIGLVLFVIGLLMAIFLRLLITKMFCLFLITDGIA